MDKKLVTCGLFLDFSKAFDTINHDILLSKLYSYGIRGNPLRWFESYLYNRNQVVKIGDTTISSFIKSKLSNVSSPPVVPVEQPVWILLPFKDQKSADVLRKQLNNPSNRIGTPLQPIYTSRKLGNALSVKEQKPSLINQHSVVYKFSCPLCDAEYISLTTRHLFQRIEEHCRSSSSICRHLQQDHDTTPRSLD